MENKRFHYDGSFQNHEGSNEEFINEPFKMTDEMRASISGNPYTYMSTDSE
ncbi:hypothetical protein [Neobacillus kokaensis]|uniref:Uncharacterized protein n=1 Tax=Neobacillus kokaensis TaxID=2759023 RepID=A0ABQ3NAS7_9BACI|nr:hypothetical protein [Neobacillus kokaensis]GHI00362.1 hypothetical protein AM1BK_39040 [Neobacillus kokaensis]